MEEFTEGIQVIRIPTCKHFFHNMCVKKWFDMKMIGQLQLKCPFCNIELNVQDMKKEKDTNLESSENCIELQPVDKICF